MTDRKLGGGKWKAVLQLPVIDVYWTDPDEEQYIPLSTEEQESTKDILSTIVFTQEGDDTNLNQGKVGWKIKNSEVGTFTSGETEEDTNIAAGVATNTFKASKTNTGKTKIDGKVKVKIKEGTPEYQPTSPEVKDTSKNIYIIKLQIKEIKPDPFREYDQFTTIVLKVEPSGYTGYKELRIYNSSGNEVKSYPSLATWSIQWNGQDNSGKYVWPGIYSVKVAIESGGTATDTKTVTVNPKLHDTGITHNDKFLKTAWRWVIESISLSAKTTMRFSPENADWPEDDYPLSYVWGGILAGTTKSITNNFSATSHKAGRWDGTLQVDTQDKDKQSDSDDVDIILGAVPDQATIKASEGKKAPRWSKTAKIKYESGTESNTFFREFTNPEHTKWRDYAIEITEHGSQETEVKYDDTNQLNIWTANELNGLINFVIGGVHCDPNAPLNDPQVTELYEE